MANEPLLPGMDVLGLGYDATGNYADASSLTLRVFDLGSANTTVTAPNGKVYAMPASIKDSCVFADMSHGNYHRISGESADEYHRSLTVDAKVSAEYGLFSGSVKAHFSQEEIASFNHTFVTLFHHYDLWTVALPDISTLKMLPSAKADIDGASGMSPAGVIRKYGTHVLGSAVIGGRARYSCFVDRSLFKSKTSIVAAVEAAYKGALKLDMSAQVEHKDDVDRLRSSARIDFDTIGGSFRPDFNPASFVDWMSSFKEHPVLVDFTHRSLIEIYKLADTPQRRSDLKDAFAQHIKNTQQLIPDDFPLLEVEIVPASSIDPVASDAGSHARMNLKVYRPKLPEGWFWVGQSGNCSNRLVRVKPLVPGAVTKPLGFQSAWNDAGSGRDHGYSLWNISTQPGYRALGGLARLRTGRTDWSAPQGDEVKGLACVHESLCTEGTIGGLIWNDAGMHARAHGSIWEIRPKDANGIDAHTFYCQNSHARPEAKVYVLSTGARVKLVDSA